MEEGKYLPSSEIVILTGEGQELIGAESHGDVDLDIQAIRDVLSVHHVPVVASLHWNKLHSVLHTLSDRISLQALRLDKAEELRLEKAEEQGKVFLDYKDELDRLWSAVREMKEARENDIEQQKNWSKTIQECIQGLQEGVDANSDGMKQLGNSLADQLHNLDARVESFTTQLAVLQEATKNFDRLDALEEATKNLEAVQATHPASFESLNQRLEELFLDLEEQNEKLHSLEEQNEQLKLKLEQTAKSHASDLDVLQQYCKNLRSDFELKFLVDVGKMQPPVDEELSNASKVKLEAAVAELQNRIQKKADADDLEKITQSTLSVKDAFQKMESNIVELQFQVKKLTPGSRRTSRLSTSETLVPNNLQLSIPNSKDTTTSTGNIVVLVEELTKDIKDAVQDNKKGLEKVQKDFELLGKSILIMSGHHGEQLSEAESAYNPNKLYKIDEDLRSSMAKCVVDTSVSKQAVICAVDTMVEKALSFSESKRSSTEELKSIPEPLSASFPLHLMDDDAVILAIDEALKFNKIEPKESSKSISRILEELEKASTRINDLEAAMPAVKNGLVLKADKRDMQRLACYVKEQLQMPENVLFTRKPLYGFKCVSCDHPIDKLSPVTGEHLPTNRMPPQVLPMLSAERIYSLDRRSSNGFAVQVQAPSNKLCNGGMALGLNASMMGGDIIMGDSASGKCDNKYIGAGGNDGNAVNRRPVTAPKTSNVGSSLRKSSALRRTSTTVA